MIGHGPRFTTDGAYDPEVRVEFASALVVGWSTDGTVLQAEDSLDHDSDHVVSGPQLSQSQRLGIALDCSDRRTANPGFAVLLGLVAADVALGSRSA